MFNFYTGKYLLVPLSLEQGFLNIVKLPVVAGAVSYHCENLLMSNSFEVVLLFAMPHAQSPCHSTHEHTHARLKGKLKRILLREKISCKFYLHWSCSGYDDPLRTDDI